MAELPASVVFHEHGPREGFQIENRHYPLAQRAALVDAIATAGLGLIQVASFVNPKVVPTMADSRELFEAIEKRAGVRYTALWLNPWGFEQAAATPAVDLDGKIVLYASDGFCLSNNNCTAREARTRLGEWTALYDSHGIALEQVYVLAAFGCNFEGEVPIAAVIDEVRFAVEQCRAEGRELPRIDLDDTMGWATRARSGTGSGRCATPFPRSKSACICTIRAGSVVPAFSPRWKWACVTSTARSAASAAARSHGSRTSTPPATSAPRTWCFCVMSSASKPASISRH
jgi:hypothetical protein